MTYLEPGVAVTPGICQHLPAAKVVVTWAIAFQQSSQIKRKLKKIKRKFKEIKRKLKEITRKWKEIQAN